MVYVMRESLIKILFVSLISLVLQTSCKFCESSYEYFIVIKSISVHDSVTLKICLLSFYVLFQCP